MNKLVTQIAGVLTLFSVQAIAQPESQHDSQPKKDIYDEAFKSSLHAVFPLNEKGRIRKFIKNMDYAQKEMHRDPEPLLTSRVVNVKQGPGQPATRIHVGPGYVSTLIFTDSTGKPWPITSYIAGESVPGDKHAKFSVVRPKDLKPGNLITVTGLVNHVNSNLVVTLLDHDIPITIHLISEDALGKQDVFDSLVTFVINKPGPNAGVPAFTQNTESLADQTMLDFINGTPPAEAIRVSHSLEKQYPGIEIYQFNEAYYVRTPYPMRLPAWSKYKEGYQVMVYKIPPALSIVLSINGVNRTLTVN